MPEKGIYGFPTIILLVSVGKTFQLFGAGNESCNLAGNESSAARLKSIMGKYAVTNGVEENTWLIKWNWQQAQKRDFVP